MPVPTAANLWGERGTKMALLTNKEYLELHEMIKEAIGENYLELEDIRKAKRAIRLYDEEQPLEKQINATYQRMAYDIKTGHWGYDLTDFDRYPKFVRTVRRLLGMPKRTLRTDWTLEIAYLSSLVSIIEEIIIPDATIPDYEWGTGEEIKWALQSHVAHVKSLLERDRF